MTTCVKLLPCVVLLTSLIGHAEAGPLLTHNFDRDAPAVKVAATASGVTAEAAIAPVGTIDVAGATTPSAAIRLSVRTAATSGAWTAAAVVGPEAVRIDESDLRKITLGFMASVSTLQPITVRVESVDAAGRVTGAGVVEVYPAAANFYQRFSLELSSLKPDGAKAFDPTSRGLRLSFGLKSEPGLPAADTRELCVDNVQLATPSFYVSPAGDDHSDGKTAATALATPQRAVERAGPGDIILLGGGTYLGSGDSVMFPHGGTPAGWITLKNAPGETPVLKSSGWSVVRIGLGSKDAADTGPALGYIEFRGLQMVGSNTRDSAGRAVSPHPELFGKVVPETNGNGLHIEGRYMTRPVHHIRVADCVITGHPGAGLGACYSDWLYFEHNVTRDNAWFTNYACSGISILLGSAFDGTTGGYRFLVSGNFSSGNRCYQKWTASSTNDAPKKLSDGNGIIIDTLGGSAVNTNETHAPFTGRTLVVNNVSFNNGGSGIHLVSSPNVDLVNNTTYLNGATPETKYSQMFGYRSPGSNFVNNILVAPPGQKYNLSSSYGEQGNTDVVWSHTLFFGSDVPPKPGTEGLTADPLFVRPSRDPKEADFTLRPGSPARAAGTRPANVPVPLTDIDGHLRPLGRDPSIGASQPPE